MRGTITDSNGRAWRWVQRGEDRYGLELIRFSRGYADGITSSQNETIVDNAPTVKWEGRDFYADSLEVHADGRLITGGYQGEW